MSLLAASLMATVDGWNLSLGAVVLAGIALSVFGGLLGRAVTTGVGHLIRVIETDGGVDGHASRIPSRAARRAFEIGAVVTSLLLFGWQVLLGGLEAVVSVPADGAGWQAAVPRVAAHLVLFAFMAAAVWCDFEYRLIPDAITVPGALSGMVCVTLLPGLLLPVGSQQARSFATPLVVPDVLGAFGPLRATAGSEWLGPFPDVVGLFALFAAFAAWWLVCTAPVVARAGWRDPRTWLLPVGLVAIGGAWSAGGASEAMRIHFRAAEASLFGAIVSGGIVWLIRACASRALGKEAMGLGDVTLMAMVGSWSGWQHGVLAFFAAAFIGLAQGLVTLARHRDNELPYGPSLCLASGLIIVGWRTIWERVGVVFEEPLLLFGVLAGVVLLTALSLAAWAGLRGRG